MHGSFDATTGAPLYEASSSSSSVYWRSANRVPSSWALLMYDCVWFYATALDALRRAGGDPHDGAALRTALLSTQLHEGVTGPIRLDGATQDRLADVSLYQVLQRDTRAALSNRPLSR